MMYMCVGMQGNDHDVTKAGLSPHCTTPACHAYPLLLHNSFKHMQGLYEKQQTIMAPVRVSVRASAMLHRSSCPWPWADFIQKQTVWQEG